MTYYNDVYCQNRALDDKIISLTIKKDYLTREIKYYLAELTKFESELKTTESLLCICEKEKNNLQLKPIKQEQKQEQIRNSNIRTLEEKHNELINRILRANESNNDETKFHCRYCYKYDPMLFSKPFMYRYCCNDCHSATEIPKRQLSNIIVPCLGSGRIARCDVIF